MTDLSFSPNVDVPFSLTNLRNPEPGTVDTTTENDISFTFSEGGKSSDMSEEERGKAYIPTSTNSSTESESGDDMNCQKIGTDNDMKYIVLFSCIFPLLKHCLYVILLRLSKIFLRKA